MAIFKLPLFAWFTGVMSLLGTMADALDGNASVGGWPFVISICL